VHTGTPHQEETVLDVAESLSATYPLVVLPSVERLERALFISLSAVALQAVHDAEIKLGDSVSVHGMGAIGLMAIQMCLLEGIQNVFAVDPDPRRRELAVGFGATDVLDPTSEESVGLQVRDRNHGRGVDVAIDVSGSDRGLQGALSAAGLGATVVAAGFYQGGAANLRLGEEFHHNRLSLIASIGGWGTPNRHAPLWDRRRVLDVATRLLYTDRVSVKGLLDKTFPFADAPEAYEWLDEHPQDAVKVGLEYGGAG
jgi:threonine dehydrogenase-like Zn-dependent dehydrogenase